MKPPRARVRLPRAAGLQAAAAGAALATAWLVLGCGVAPELEPEPEPEAVPLVSMPLFAHPGACSQCHEAMRNGVPTEVPHPGRCATPECHPSLQTPARFVHGPVAVGDCRACHRQHSAVERHLLVRPPTPLCLGCHDRLITCPVAAQPAASPCVSCHDPHGGPMHLLRPGAPQGATASAD